MYRVTLIAFAVLALSPTAGRGESAQQAACTILERSGVTGGLVVQLGVDDGELVTALGQQPCYVVQALDIDETQVRQARETIHAHGFYGRVSVSDWQGKRLPYADNLVNLVVVREPGDVEMNEIMRVLAPYGVVLTKESGNWTKQLKPWPAEFDEWSHYLHGPDNNAVSRDTLVGPPQSMQWVCGPPYARSHEINSSMAGMVSARGRIFYIWDEGPLGQAEKRFPSQWALICRDGFNGMPLWKVPMPEWGWRQWHEESRWDEPRDRAAMLRQLPRATTRRLVAAGDTLFVTLGYQAAVSALDAATGELRYTIAGTEGTDEILLDSGKLVLCVRDTDRSNQRRGRDFRLDQNPGRIVVVDPENRRVLWQSEPDSIMPLSLSVCQERIYHARQGQVVCLDRADGHLLWESEFVKGGGQNGTLVAQDGVVLFAYGPVTPVVEKRNYQNIRYHQAHAFSARTGEKLWSSPPYRGPSGNGLDVFVIGGLVWFGVDNQENLPDHWRETVTQRIGYDLLTGAPTRKVSVAKLTSPGHHYRCYRSKATERFLLLPKRGVEFLDLAGDDHMRHDWLRAPCIYGVMPANGMLYVAPHQCVCYQGVLMSNFNALTSTPASVASASEPTGDGSRLFRGTKYGQVELLRSESDKVPEWPMYRHDSRRSGYVETVVPGDLARRWDATFSGPITPPVVAGGKLLVAEKDAHTIHALDAETGRKLWRYTAGGRIDSPPTMHGALVLFGSADGWVYCLEESKGEEVWRFRAAPREKLVGAFGQVESAWPVHGSVIVQNDVTSEPARPLVYCTAGRSTYLDGGIRAYALDPLTGEVVHENCLSGPRPDPHKDVGGAGYMDGAKSDILVSDGADLFLHQERLRGDLQRVPAAMQEFERERGGYRVYPAAPERGSTAQRLISTRGFLDDSYNEGTYWTYGDRWPGWDRHMNRVPAYGQILSFDDERLYGVHVFYEVVRVRRGFFPGTRGYRLFARDHGATENRWSVFIPVRVRAIVATADKLFVAGPPDVIPDEDSLAAFEGRLGARLWSFAADDGQKLAEVAQLDAPAVYDGLIAADQKLYVSLTDGRLLCFAANASK